MDGDEEAMKQLLDAGWEQIPLGPYDETPRFRHPYYGRAEFPLQFAVIYERVRQRAISEGREL